MYVFCAPSFKKSQSAEKSMYDNNINKKKKYINEGNFLVIIHKFKEHRDKRYNKLACACICFSPGVSWAFRWTGVLISS